MAEKIACPFVYADGKKCCGVIYRARGYGPGAGVNRDNVRKYRLWCSEHDDHTGAVSSSAAKARMEFYPGQLPTAVEDRLWSEELLS